MSCRFLDGMNLCDPAGFLLKYPAGLVNFYQAQIVPGPRSNTRGLWNVNNAFGEANFTPSPFDARAAWTVGFYFQPINQAGGTTFASTVEFFRAADVDGPLFGLNYDTFGRLNVTDANQTGSGTVVYQTYPSLPVSDPGFVPAFVIGRWVHIEVRMIFGIHGSFEVRLNGVTVATQSRAVGRAGHFLADRFTLRGQNFAGTGPAFSSFYVLDDAAGVAGFQGPCVVVSMPPLSEQISGWIKNGGAVSLIDAIADNTTAGGRISFPDGDSTYAVQDRGRELVTVARAECFGRVLALAVNAVASQSGILTLSVRPRSALYTIGVVTLATPGYRSYQLMSENNPEGGVWTDGVIAQAAFGFEGAGPRLTQFYVEKLVSLDPLLSYNCGPGSYGY